MTLGTPYVADTTAVLLKGGSLGQLTAAQVSSVYGSGNVKTASRTFHFPFNGQILAFIANVPKVVTPDLAAALAASGAPVS